MGRAINTILVSGSTGFLGSHLLKILLKNKYRVIALKRSTSDTFRIKHLSNHLIFYDVDEVSIESIFINNKIDAVINTVTDYGRSGNEILSIIQTNLIFGLKLLNESLSFKVKVFINTDTILNRDLNYYSLSKAQFVDWMKLLNLCNTKIVNLKMDHIYGPFDDDKKFVFKIINQLKSNCSEIDLTEGKQKRNFIYIDDITSAYIIILEKYKLLSNFEQFELGTGNNIELRSFIEKIHSKISKQQVLNTSLNFGAMPYRENENMDVNIDSSRIKELGWESKISIDEGISKTINEGKV